MKLLHGMLFVSLLVSSPLVFSQTGMGNLPPVRKSFLKGEELVHKRLGFALTAPKDWTWHKLPTFEHSFAAVHPSGRPFFTVRIDPDHKGELTDEMMGEFVTGIQGATQKFKLEFVPYSGYPYPDGYQCLFSLKLREYVTVNTAVIFKTDKMVKIQAPSPGGNVPEGFHQFLASYRDMAPVPPPLFSYVLIKVIVFVVLWYAILLATRLWFPALNGHMIALWLIVFITATSIIVNYANDAVTSDTIKALSAAIIPVMACAFGSASHKMSGGARTETVESAQKGSIPNQSHLQKQWQTAIAGSSEAEIIKFGRQWCRQALRDGHLDEALDCWQTLQERCSSHRWPFGLSHKIAKGLIDRGDNRPARVIVSSLSRDKGRLGPQQAIDLVQIAVGCSYPQVNELITETAARGDLTSVELRLLNQLKHRQTQDPHAVTRRKVYGIRAHITRIDRVHVTLSPTVGSPTRLPLASIKMIGVGVIQGAESFIMLCIGIHRPDGSWRLISVDSRTTSAADLMPSVDPAWAWRHLALRLLEATGAQPWPNKAAVTGHRYVGFPSVAAFENAIREEASITPVPKAVSAEQAQRRR